MDSIVRAFEEGGAWMYAILVVNIIVVGIAVERTLWLYLQAGMNRQTLMGAVTKFLRAGDVKKARSLVAKRSAPIAKVLSAGLGTQGQGPDAAMMLMKEATLMEVPKLEARIGYLAMFSNIATLLGLLGTIVGLIRSFSAVASASAADKATELSKGISEAMNCTAFGLIVAITALLLFAWLQNRAQKLVDDVRIASTSLGNVISEVSW